MHIIICGAGLAGLTCAIACRQRGFGVTVLERDSSETARSQGGGIDVRAAGVDVLRSLGLLPALSRLVIERDTAQFVLETADGRVLRKYIAKVPKIQTSASVSQTQKSEGGTDVDLGYGGAKMSRGHFREMLREQAVAAGATIIYDAAFSHYEEAADGVTVHGASGVAVRGHVLVGADGINSGVRRQLVGDKLQLHGYRRVGGRVEGPTAVKLSVALRELNATRGVTGAAKHVALGVGCSMYAGTGKPPLSESDAQAGDKLAELAKPGAIGWGFTYAPALLGDGRPPAWWDTEHQAAFHALVRDHLRGAGGFHPLWAAMVEASDPATIHVADSAAYPTFARFGVPLLGTRPHDLDDEIARNRKTGSGATSAISVSTLPRRVTVLGDACHPVTAWAGNGATQALVDAYQLAECLAHIASEPAVEGTGETSGPAIHAALKAFEADMLARGGAVTWAGVSIMRFLHPTSPLLARLRDALLAAFPVLGSQRVGGAAKGHRSVALRCSWLTDARAAAVSAAALGVVVMLAAVFTVVVGVFN